MLLLIISFFLLASIGYSEASEADYLLRLIKTRRSSRNSLPQHSLFAKTEYSPVYIEPQQDGSMQLDKINALPGQPSGINFDQYAGYVTVDPKAGRALFYYFVESPQNSSTNPLVLWLNGGIRIYLCNFTTIYYMPNFTISCMSFYNCRTGMFLVRTWSHD